MINSHEVVRRYLNGRNFREIAAEMGSTAAKIRSVALSAGVQPRRPGWRPPRSDAERFWAFVDKRDEHDCWEWKGYREKSGYGAFKPTSHNPCKASRMVFFLTHGYWPTVARHTCDNPPCVNPAHIVDGTHADNNHDMRSRGRARYLRGEKHSKAKLSAEDVVNIRTLAGLCSQAALGREFGINASGISNIIAKRTWRAL